MARVTSPITLPLAKRLRRWLQASGEAGRARAKLVQIPLAAVRGGMHIAAVHRLNDEILDRGRLDLLPEVFAADFVSGRRGMPALAALLGPAAASPAVVGTPLEQLARRFSALRIAFPDWRSDIREIVAAGDLVAVRYALSGTHGGPLFGVAPTGRRVSLDEAVFYRFANGKIREDWAIGDELALAEQLGLLDLVRPA